jgi:hypothetical protein
MTAIFSPLSFVAVFGSGIRDPGSEIRDPGSEIRDPGSGMGKNQDSGSEINIPDPQHCTHTKRLPSSGRILVVRILEVSFFFSSEALLVLVESDHRQIVSGSTTLRATVI